MDERDAKNPHDAGRTPVERDGVAYTPSRSSADDFDFDYDFDPDAVKNTSPAPSAGADEDLARTRKITAPPPREGAPKRQPGSPPKPTAQNSAVVRQVQKRKPPPKKPAPKKAHYAILLVTTVFVGVIAVVFVFAMMFNEWSLGSNDSGPSQAAGTQNQQQAEPEAPVEQPPMELAPGNISIIGLVQEINPASRRIDLYIFEISQPRSFFVENHSILRDKFGNAITFAEFNLGDVVEIAHLEGTTVVETARVSAQVRTYRNIRDVVVDIENQMVLIGNSRYPFTQRTVVMYHGEPNSITDVSTVDIVTVDTFNGQVVFVDIHQGNGVIHIPENDMIIQGTVEVANTTFAGLEGEMEIRVPEGDHRVIIRGINIEDFQYELTVTRGGYATVNFDGLELLAGSLTVNVADPYVSLTIDGEVQLTNSMIMLEYGTYTVSVTRDGFVPFVQEVTIDSANHEITVVLEEIIRTQNLTLTTSPPGARMYLDGEYIGLSPVTLELELRRYSVTMALEGFVGGTTDIWVTEEQPIFSWWLQNDPNFTPQTPMPTPPPYQPTPSPTPLYPEVSPSPTPTPFFRR